MAKLKNKIQKKLGAKTRELLAGPPPQNLPPQTQQPQQQIFPKIPGISVIIPMYNAERYIKSCIMSVLRQTLQDFELICVDDCSTDNTVQVVMELAQKDSRIRLVKLAQNSGGASEPRNMGLRLSRGKYIMFLDADDMYTPTALEELGMIAEKWQADVVHTEQV